MNKDVNNSNNNNNEVIIADFDEAEEDRKPAARPLPGTRTLLYKSVSSSLDNQHIATAIFDRVLEDEEEDRKPAARPTSLLQHSTIINHVGTTTTTAATQDGMMSTLRMNARNQSEAASTTMKMQDTTEDAADCALAVHVQLDEKERFDAASCIQMHKEMDDDVCNNDTQQDNNNNSGMHTTITGRAWMFVEHVLKLHTGLVEADNNADAASMSSSSSSASSVDLFDTPTTSTAAVAVGNVVSCPLILPVASNDMVAMTERLLMKQEEFRLLGKPTHVDIGYHYTRSENLATIQTDGLMSGRERNVCDISPARYNGSVFGDGIYTSLNMTASAHFGDIGIVVARLLGCNALHPDTRRLDSRDGGSDHPDSLTVFSGQLNEFTVLGNSQQCIPIFQFDSSQLVRFDPDHRQNQKVFEYHVQLQKLIDGMFNGGMVTAISDRVKGPNYASRLMSSRSQRPTNYRRWVWKTQRHGRSMNRTLPTVTNNCRMLAMSGKSDWNDQRLDVRSYAAPESLERSLDQTDFCQVVGEGTSGEISNFCVFCLDPLMKVFRYDDAQAKTDLRIVKLRVCEHVFHYGCFQHLLLSSSSSPRCPACRTNIGVPPQGPMPSGTMEIHTSRSSCAGYESFGTIAIVYLIPCNIQKQYHPHPGRRHGSAYWQAYLPDTTEGRQLLERLIYAFEHGLTFNIGFSWFTGCDDSVIWSPIPHKTSQSGGTHVHGFPDASFFTNCNQALTDLNVPSAYYL